MAITSTPDDDNPARFVQLPAVPAHYTAVEAWDFVWWWVWINAHRFRQLPPPAR